MYEENVHLISFYHVYFDLLIVEGPKKALPLIYSYHMIGRGGENVFKKG